MKYKAIGLALLLSQFAVAGDLAVTGGVGVFNSGKSSLSESKLLKVGYEAPLYRAIKQRVNGGFWLDNAGNGKTDSGFGGYQVGFVVDNDTVEASFFTGPALISSPDALLGGPLQFNESVFLGARSSTGEVLGVGYEHFSSAGIYTPNIGRDFVVLGMKISL